MEKPIYFDYNSTTPVDPEVLEMMTPLMGNVFGNPSSKTHKYGDDARMAVEKARIQIARLINADTKNIILTSSATESINLALKGTFESSKYNKDHIITAQTEHNAVLDTCSYLESKGARITYLPVDENGVIDLNSLKEAISKETLLVAIMYANNETGVIQPINEIAKITKERDVLFMTDATQAVGKIPVDVENKNIDYLTFSAHKLYGLKGAGALYVNNINKGRIIPQNHGGGHENGMRSGTLNVPAIAAFGKACEICINRLESDTIYVSKLRDELESEILSLGNNFVNGNMSPRLPNTTNICFEGIDADDLILMIKRHIAVSTGSACTSATFEPSNVLKAMGLTQNQAYSSVRFSLGRFTNEKEIKQAFSILDESIHILRKIHDFKQYK